MSQSKFFQGFALIAGTSLFLFALGIFFSLPAATSLWIWPETPRLGFIFVAAMLAGAAAPLIWIGLSGQVSAIRAAMLAGMVANTGIALHLYLRHALPGKERFLPFAALFAFGAILTSALFGLSQRIPVTGDRSIPPVIRWVFLLFSAILLPVGAAMVLGIPRIFPIPLTTDMAAVYGWFLLGSFTYYVYGFCKPSQLNSTGHLLSFLVYDLLMLPAYSRYWAVVAPEYRTSLFVYLMVLITSAIFCGYFLLIDPRTRLFTGGGGIPSMAHYRE
ncbi:MAG TPA: hypothetical protein VLM91_11070 [Candidatus Methylomirabilis sp.]|nr:hypothetical protein [Candidatus Methylomirabilis sp.]